jgi:hypothetical protein
MVFEQGVRPSVQAHETTHAYQMQLERALRGSKVGRELLSRSFAATREAFPEAGTSLEHSFRSRELADGVREFRRVLGRDPTADDVRELLGRGGFPLTRELAGYEWAEGDRSALTADLWEALQRSELSPEEISDAWRKISYAQPKGSYERTLTGGPGSLSSALGREYEKVVG